MEVSLNRAIKYRNRLSEAVMAAIPETTKQIRYSSVEELEEGFDKANQEVGEVVESSIEDIAQLFHLRQLISEANSTGSSEIMNEIEMKQSQISYISAVIKRCESGGAYRTPMTVEDASDNFNKAKALEEIKPEAIVGTVSSAILIVKQEQLENMKGGLLTLSREIEDLKEQRNARNTSVLVTLDEGIVGALKRHSIL